MNIDTMLREIARTGWLLAEAKQKAPPMFDAVAQNHGFTADDADAMIKLFQTVMLLDGWPDHPLVEQFTRVSPCATNVLPDPITAD